MAARRNLASARQSVDIRGTGGGGGGGDGQSLEDMAGSRKKITTLENIQRRGIKLDMITGGARPGGQNLSSLRTRVMPTHEKFDSHLYLGTVHWVREAAACECVVNSREVRPACLGAAQYLAGVQNAQSVWLHGQTPNINLSFTEYFYGNIPQGAVLFTHASPGSLSFVQQEQVQTCIYRC